MLEVLTRAYKDEHGAEQRLSVVVAGSGEILAMAARGDVDVVLAHSPDAEVSLVESGGAESRLPVMHNDFIIAGAPADPAGAAAAQSAVGAFRRIAAAGHPFVSRGDDSGTHRREQELWAEAGIVPAWSGYMEAGTGMADALRLASERGAYILSDRATYEVLRHELGLYIMIEGGDDLVNQYSVLVTANAANVRGARSFAQWLTEPGTRQLIAGYRAPGSSRALFSPGG
jgi:tungstate transport system substrate-binding protein